MKKSTAVRRPLMEVNDIGRKHMGKSTRFPNFYLDQHLFMFKKNRLKKVRVSE